MLMLSMRAAYVTASTFGMRQDRYAGMRGDVKRAVAYVREALRAHDAMICRRRCRLRHDYFDICAMRGGIFYFRYFTAAYAPLITRLLRLRAFECRVDAIAPPLI